MKAWERHHRTLRAVAVVAAGAAVFAFAVIFVVPNVLAIYGVIINGH